jgi:endonuclease/exonuclease/phosphatase family metal-dependent hydrolase
MRLRLLTFNAGLLKIFGRSAPVPYVPERLAHLPAEIRKLDADIVLLQEVYGESTRRAVAEALKDVYPYADLPYAKRRFGLANGLMTLSRFPATHVITLFRDASPDEGWLDSKGFLATTHSLPTGEKLTCVNVHTTAGGIFAHPESGQIDRIRALQIEQILDHRQELDSLLLVAGDLNAGPGVSESNFRQMLHAGFVSLHDFLHGEISQPTWDPLNPLNIKGPHKHCPPQRIDHVFVHGNDIGNAAITPVSSEICLQAAVVPVAAKEYVSISDHYGLLVEFEICFTAGSTVPSA